MTPVQRMAAGLLLVAVDAYFGLWDAVPDPLGWVLLVAGVVPLREVLPQGRGLLGAAVVAALTSVVVVALHADAPAAETDPLGLTVPLEAQWALSLPQTVFLVLLCRALAERLDDWVTARGASLPAEDRTASRARNLARLGWLFAVLALVPPVVLGAGLDALLAPAGLLVVLATLALLLWLVLLARHPALRSEGPPPGEDRPAGSGDDEGGRPRRDGLLDG